jgi:hypothetical protein
MLNSKDESWSKTRFDFLYYPEAQKAKYIFFGRSEFITEILHSFDMLCRQKEV